MQRYECPEAETRRGKKIMKQIIHSVIFLICSISNCWGQTINFTVIQLKAYLLNETCVDTSANPSWAGQFNVDLNNDNEIQISEALAVQHLILNDFGDNYSIQSLLDLNYFSNLTFLEVIQLDSLSEFRNMQLDSLKSLHIIDLLS
jgi:hypothetical protein